MLCAYLDESYTSDFFSVGAAIATSDVWDEVSDALHGVVAGASRQFGVPATSELHGHALMGGAGDWAALRGRHREIANVYETALRVLAKHDVRFIFRGLDVVRLRNRYRYPRPPHQIVLAHILERIDEFGSRHGCEPESMIVSCDEVGTQIEHQAQFLSAKLVGTPGYRSSRLTHISAPLNFLQSSNAAPIQAADLAVYLYRRRQVVAVERHPQAQRIRERLWGIMAPQIDHQHVWVP